VRADRPVGRAGVHWCRQWVSARRRHVHADPRSRPPTPAILAGCASQGCRWSPFPPGTCHAWPVSAWLNFAVNLYALIVVCTRLVPLRRRPCRRRPLAGGVAGWPGRSAAAPVAFAAGGASVAAAGGRPSAVGAVPWRSPDRSASYGRLRAAGGTSLLTMLIGERQVIATGAQSRVGIAGMRRSPRRLAGRRGQRVRRDQRRRPPSPPMPCGGGGPVTPAAASPEEPPGPRRGRALACQVRSLSSLGSVGGDGGRRSKRIGDPRRHDVRQMAGRPIVHRLWAGGERDASLASVPESPGAAVSALQSVWSRSSAIGAWSSPRDASWFPVQASVQAERQDELYQGDDHRRSLLDRGHVPRLLDGFRQTAMSDPKPIQPHRAEIARTLILARSWSASGSSPLSSRPEQPAPTG
jgi:hypothetical protein